MVDSAQRRFKPCTFPAPSLELIKGMEDFSVVEKGCAQGRHQSPKKTDQVDSGSDSW